MKLTKMREMFSGECVIPEDYDREIAEHNGKNIAKISIIKSFLYDLLNPIIHSQFRNGRGWGGTANTAVYTPVPGVIIPLSSTPPISPEAILGGDGGEFMEAWVG